MSAYIFVTGSVGSHDHKSLTNEHVCASLASYNLGRARDVHYSSVLLYASALAFTIQPPPHHPSYTPHQKKYMYDPNDALCVPRRAIHVARTAFVFIINAITRPPTISTYACNAAVYVYVRALR